MRTTRFVLAQLGAAGLILTAACGATTTGSDSYPSKGIRIIVPYPAGGGVDIAARAIAPCLEDELGQNVIVENKAGGSGASGTVSVLSEKADGYTLGVTLTSAAVVTPLSADVGYTVSDLLPIGQIVSTPYVIVVEPDSPYDSFDDVVAAGHGTDLKAAVPGAASQGELELKLLAKAGLDVTSVPYDGSAGVKTAVLGGDVDFGIVGIDADILSQHQAGTLRILATTGAERTDYLPDTPSVTETTDFSDLGSGTSYIGLIARDGTPSDITTTLEATLKTCLTRDDVTSIVGAEFVAQDFVDGAQLDKLFTEQADVYADVIEGN